MPSHKTTVKKYLNPQQIQQTDFDRFEQELMSLAQQHLEQLQHQNTQIRVQRQKMFLQELIMAESIRKQEQEIEELHTLNRQQQKQNTLDLKGIQEKVYFYENKTRNNKRGNSYTQLAQFYEMEQGMNQDIFQNETSLKIELSQKTVIEVQNDSLKMDLSTLQKQQETQQKEYQQILVQTEEYFLLRKRLNDELQEQKGNIRVYCRIRPSNESQNNYMEVSSSNTLRITIPSELKKSSNQAGDFFYTFDQIFSPLDNNECVFGQLEQLVQSSIDGKNVCIFAYGQTGSGKTHTLIGPQENYKTPKSKNADRGIIQRSIEKLFEEIKKYGQHKWQYEVNLSIQEIYNDSINDLLKNEQIQIDKYREVVVKGVNEIQCLLNESKKMRKVSSTFCNERSSRSHLIVMLRLTGTNGDRTREGSLVMVDLAGSERIKDSKVEGDKLKEAQYINSSLSSLGTVINSLKYKKDKQSHISFRNSKLTHVLQRYLEGDSKTLMFVNVSPDIKDLLQTKNSLNFAESVRCCKQKR